MTLEHVNSLTSANIENLPKRWIKNVNLNELSEEAKNRLSLGCGGQRFLQAISYINQSDFAPNTQLQQDYIVHLITWTNGQVYWDLHPIYKSPNIITATRSLNKTRSDCLFSALTPAAKVKLVQARNLFEEPIAQPAHSQWRNYLSLRLPELTNPVFPL